MTLLAVAGCQPAAKITSYTVPKPETVETPPNKPAGGGGMPPMSRPGAESSADSLQAEAPEGWKEGPPKQFTLKFYEVVDGDERLEISLSRAGGDMSANMNRWRGQIGLPPASSEELEAAFQPREVNGLPAKFIEMHQAEGADNRQSILGVVVPEGNQTWFIKLRGSTKLAEREREHFEAFAKSVRW
jgi:hypothetical protein